MEDVRNILRIPNREVISVTRALAGLDLEKIDTQQCTEDKYTTVMIHTRGFFLADILCEINERMCDSIISGMYGGGMPPDSERPLYLNEYMNIVCGRIVSKVNTLTGSVSKLSTPEYCGAAEPDLEINESMHCIRLAYQNGQGLIRFIIQFDFQQNGGEDI